MSRQQVRVVLEHVLRVAALEDGVEEPAVAMAVRACDRGEILGRARERVIRDEVDRDPDPRLRGVPPQHVGRPPVREQDVVRRCERVGVVGAARGVHAEPVAEPRDHPRLALRDPVRHAVAEAPDHGLHVLDVRVDGLAHRPAAAVLERLRQVPVVQRDERLDAGGQELVHEAVVEVEARLVAAAAAVRKDPRPGDREAEGVEPELAHEAHVVRVAVVRIAGDAPAVAVRDLAGGRGEAVPDALASPVLVRRALDLVRGDRRAPREIAGKLSVCHGQGVPSIAEPVKKITNRREMLEGR